MNESYIYSTEIINAMESPFDKEPFYANLFLFALLILFVAFNRRKIARGDQEYYGDLESYDVLSLPSKPLTNEHFPKDGVLFNTGSKVGLIESIGYTFLAFVVFAVVTSVLYPFVNRVGCILL